MTDEPEEVEDEGDYAPEDAEICSGSLVIHDLEKWRSAAGMNALATQVTDEGAVYVVDADSLKLRMVPLDDGKSRKLTRVQ
jgi:hypothetical protein